MEWKTKVVAIGIVEFPDGRILLSQRYEPINPKAHLKWELPGGRNEPGESLDVTVKREILEETGLTVEVKSMLPISIQQSWDYSTYYQHTLVFCFVCKYIAGKLDKNDHKIQAHLLLHPAEALKQDLLAGVGDFLKYYMKSKGL
ncbi:MAG: NUDIX domain-containing protein [Candidatus Woesearchaeota archaeon]